MSPTLLMQNIFDQRLFCIVVLFLLRCLVDSAFLVQEQLDGQTTRLHEVEQAWLQISFIFE